MRRAERLQEVRKMRFEEAYGGWQERRLTQEEEARLLGVCERTACPRESGGSGATWTATRRRGWTGCWTSVWGRCLRGARRSMRVVRTEALYRERYEGWNVKHFYSFYRRAHGGRVATPG